MNQQKQINNKDQKKTEKTRVKSNLNSKNSKNKYNVNNLKNPSQKDQQKEKDYPIDGRKQEEMLKTKNFYTNDNTESNNIIELKDKKIGKPITNTKVKTNNESNYLKIKEKETKLKKRLENPNLNLKLGSLGCNNFKTNDNGNSSFIESNQQNNHNDVVKVIDNNENKKKLDYSQLEVSNQKSPDNININKNPICNKENIIAINNINNEIELNNLPNYSSPKVTQETSKTDIIQRQDLETQIIKEYKENRTKENYNKTANRNFENDIEEIQI